MLKNIYFWLAAAIFLILDQGSKFIIMQNFKLHDSVPLWQGVFHLTYIVNSGAAFSLFNRSGDWLKWVSLIVSLGLFSLGLFSSKLNRWEQVGYGCILGGALGNGMDRFLNGFVVDFLDFQLIRFPVFNIADIGINVGLVCLVIAIFSPNQSKNSN